MSKRQASSRSVNYATSPLLASKTPSWRSHLLVAGVGFAFAGLLGRALYIQVIGTDFYQKKGEERYLYKQQLPASRGEIVDREGQVLAASVAVPSFWANPKELAKEVEAEPERRAALAKALGLKAAELNRKLDPESGFVWLARLADEETAAKLRALKLKSLFTDREYRRKYPEGESAAHVVGFTDVEDHGQEGTERAYDDELVGSKGSRMVLRDRLGRVVDDTGEAQAPVNGKQVQLSIDSKIQFFAYQRVREAVLENKAKAGSAVVLDAQTGEVLAMANYPSYDPGNRRHLSGEQLRNRAVTDTFEPGSTMKPLIVAQALQSGRVTPDTVINTAPRSVVISGWSPSDTHPHEGLPIWQVIQKSSNIGAARLGLQMPPREMYEMYTAVGLGQRPQIHFPGAVSGRLRPYKNWRPIEQATMSYGYGLSASLLQLARAYTVFTHDGAVLPLSLAKLAPGEQPAGVRVFSPKVAQEVRLMLQTVCTKEGTAPEAQTPGYSVGGKSGTAYKQEGKGYATNKYRSWFVGISPINKPRVIVAVMIDEPTAGAHFGGAVAGPVFSQVVAQSLRLMNVAPDLEVKSQIVAGAPGMKEGT